MKKTISILVSIMLIVFTSCSGTVSEEFAVSETENTENSETTFDSDYEATLYKFKKYRELREEYIEYVETIFDDICRPNGYPLVWGLVDINFDKIPEIFAFEQTGSQGYRRCKIYEIVDKAPVVLFEFSGFSRDGATSFLERNGKTYIYRYELHSNQRFSEFVEEIQVDNIVTVTSVYFTNLNPDFYDVFVEAIRTKSYSDLDSDLGDLYYAYVNGISVSAEEYFLHINDNFLDTRPIPTLFDFGSSPKLTKTEDGKIFSEYSNMKYNDYLSKIDFEIK